MKCSLCDHEIDSQHTAEAHMKVHHPWATDMLTTRAIVPSSTPAAPLAPHVPTLGHPFRLQDLEPLRDRLLVRPLAVSSRSIGGIHLAEITHQREKPQTGIVLSRGVGVRTSSTGALLPMTCEIGDVVMFGKYSGQQFELDGETVLNMSEAEVYTRLPVGTFVVVEHESGKDWHLQGDYCDLCASPEERAAKGRLEDERAALVAAQIAQDRVVDLTAAGIDAPERPRNDDLDLGLTVAPPDSGGRSGLDAEREAARQRRLLRETVTGE